MNGAWAGLAALALSLGLDSLRAGVTLGALGRARPVTPLAFGAADAAAALLGSFAGEHVAAASGRVATWLAVAMLGGYGLAALCDRDGEPRRGLGVALPLALSGDNLVAGLGLGVLGVPVPVAVGALGLASAGLAAVGVAAGRRLRRRKVPSERVAGVALLALAALLAAT